MAALQPTTAPQSFVQVTGGAASSVNVTVDAGTDRCMAVLVSGEGNGAGAGAVTALTYGGVALTLHSRVNNPTWGYVELWRLIAPTVGTALLAVTVNAATSHYAFGVLVGQSVDQVTPLRAAVTQTGNATTGSVTVASVTADDLVIEVLDIDGAPHNGVPGADQTEHWELVPVAGSTVGICSTQPGSAGGVMSYTWTTAAPFSHLASAFIGIASGTPQTVTAPLVDAGAAVFSPTLAPGPVTVTAPLVDAAAAVFSPVVTSVVTVAPGLVDAGAAVFSPALTVGAVSIAPPLVDAGPVIFAPTVTRAGDAAGAASVRPLLGAG